MDFMKRLSLLLVLLSLSVHAGRPALTQGAWALASDPGKACLVVTNSMVWVLQDGVWRPTDAIGWTHPVVSFGALQTATGASERVRGRFWKPRDRWDLEKVQALDGTIKPGDYVWVDSHGDRGRADWRNARRMVRAPLPDWSRVRDEKAYCGIWKPVRALGGSEEKGNGWRTEALKIRADGLAVVRGRNPRRPEGAHETYMVHPWLALEGGIRLDYRAQYAKYDDPLNCMVKGFWLTPGGELVGYDTSGARTIYIRTDEPFVDPVDTRRQMLTDGVLHGVWGVNSEFNIFVLTFDRRGKGFLSGFMALMPFDWKLTADGVIRCTIDADIAAVMGGGTFTAFDCRYDPLQNRIEAVLPPNVDEGQVEPTRKVLPFMSDEVKIDEMLQRIEKMRQSPGWAAQVQRAKNRPAPTPEQLAARQRKAEERRTRQKKWEEEKAARDAEEERRRKWYRDVWEHYGETVRNEAYYSETNTLPARCLQDGLGMDELGTPEEHHVVVDHIRANPRLLPWYYRIVEQDNLLPADFEWLFKAVLDDYLVRHDRRPLDCLFRARNRDLSVAQYEEALRRIPDGDPAKEDIRSYARFRDPRFRTVPSAPARRPAPPARTEQPRPRPVVGDARVDALRRCAAEKSYDVTAVLDYQGVYRVEYVLRPTTQSFIRCQLALPAKKAWSGRLWGCGNGGGAGHVRVNVDMARTGDAVVHTDMGTSRGVHGKPEVVRDFGWRATHLMTVSAKDLAAAFFGHPPSKAYFIGGSTGGGQGFHEALRFPEDYDGIVAYVPANTRIPLHVYFAWNLRLMKDADGRDVFTSAELAAVEQAALDYFADRDEPAFRGKFLSDTRYDAKTEQGILDLAKAKVPSLDTPDKLARLHGMFTGPVLDGKPVHAGVPFGASLRAATGNQWMLFWFLGPGRRFHTVTDAELSRWLREWGPDCDACGPGFAKFAARGGKMIVVGGLEDSVVPYPSMVDWYERAAEECGGRANLEQACRLYLLPGRAHGQGRGCGNISGDSALIVRWVEKGEAPSEVRSPLRGGGELTVKPYPYNWAGSR